MARERVPGKSEEAAKTGVHEGVHVRAFAATVTEPNLIAFHLFTAVL